MAGTRPTIYFIRHGETDWNADGRLQGNQDIPLNALGRVQAEEVGARLRRLVGRYVDCDYVASPLLRTRSTMEIMRRAADLEPTRYRLDERLREVSFGRWEGLTWREIRAREPEAAARRNREKWSYVPPGGESYAMLCERVAPAIEALDRDTVVVSHGGVARAVLALLCGVPKAEAPRLDIWQGRVLVIGPAGYHWV